MSEPTVEERIRSALSFTGYPCVTSYYSGSEPVYFVMMTGSRPSNFCDDEPGHLIDNITLHLVSNASFDHTTVRKSIKAALQSAGFTYPSDFDASGSRENDGVFERRTVFEFECSEAV